MWQCKGTVRLFSASLNTKRHWKFSHHRGTLHSCMPCAAGILRRCRHCYVQRPTPMFMVITRLLTLRSSLPPSVVIFRLFVHLLLLGPMLVRMGGMQDVLPSA